MGYFNQLFFVTHLFAQDVGPIPGELGFQTAE